MDPNNQPEQIPQQPVIAPLPAPRSHLIMFVLLGVIMLTIGLGGGYLLFGNSARSTNPYPTQVAQISPTTTQQPPTAIPSPTNNPATATWKTISFNDISIKIPNTWYSSDIIVDAKTNTQIMHINPTKLPYPSDAVPGFSLYEVKNATIEQVKEEAKKAWGLSNSKETETTVTPNNLTALIVEGKTQPGFMEAKLFRYVFFKVLNNVYYFLDLDLAENHTMYFDQMVSTLTINYKQAGLGEACEGSSLMMCAKGLTCKLPEQSIASAPGICVKQ